MKVCETSNEILPDIVPPSVLCRKSGRDKLTGSFTAQEDILNRNFPNTVKLPLLTSFESFFLDFFMQHMLSKEPGDITGKTIEMSPKDTLPEEFA